MGINYSKVDYPMYRERAYQARNTENDRAVNIAIRRGVERPHFGWDRETEDDFIRNAYGGIGSPGEMKQGEMFDYEPPEFYSMFSDPSMRIPAMKLAMRAVMDHPGIVPATDLSAHSAPLVRRAIRMGVVSLPQGYSNVDQIRQTNGMHFNDVIEQDDHRDAIPDIDMKAANHLMREKLRESKPRTKPLSTSQFQPQLPIFEQPPDPTVSEFSRRAAR